MMFELPEKILVKDKENFDELFKVYLYHKLRKKVFVHLISRSRVDDYIDLEMFSHKYAVGKHSIVIDAANMLCEELKDMGWKSMLAFGKTALYIYDDVQPTILNSGEFVLS